MPTAIPVPAKYFPANYTKALGSLSSEAALELSVHPSGSPVHQNIIHGPSHLVSMRSAFCACGSNGKHLRTLLPVGTSVPNLHYLVHDCLQFLTGWDVSEQNCDPHAERRGGSDDEPSERRFPDAGQYRPKDTPNDKAEY